MKKIALLSFAVLLATGAMAANDPVNASDTVIVTVEKGKVIVVEKEDGGSRTEITTYSEKRTAKRGLGVGMVFDIGMSNYGSRNLFTGANGHDDFLSLNTAKSIDFTWYPLVGYLNLCKNSKALRLQTGLGFDWSNYRFENGWSIASVDGVTIPSDRYIDNGYSTVSKSKLTAVYMEVPLILYWTLPIKEKFPFTLGAGVIGGLRVGSHTKVKYYNGGGKFKEANSYNLNMLRYDLTFRAGFSFAEIFFNYQMTPLFTKGHGPELYPYTIGISLGMFGNKGPARQ